MMFTDAVANAPRLASPVGAPSETENVLFGSSTWSLRIGTVMVCDATLVSNTSVPATGTKSCNAVAVPFTVVKGTLTVPFKLPVRTTVNTTLPTSSSTFVTPNVNCRLESSS